MSFKTDVQELIDAAFAARDKSKRGEAALLAEINALKTNQSQLEQSHAEMCECMTEMRAENVALTLRFTELLNVKYPTPQISVDPKVSVAAPQVTVEAPHVSVAAPQIHMPAADKGGTWEITVPGSNGGPARTVTMKRTA